MAGPSSSCWAHCRCCCSQAKCRGVLPLRSCSPGFTPLWISAWITLGCSRYTARWSGVWRQIGKGEDAPQDTRCDEPHPSPGASLAARADCHAGDPIPVVTLHVADTGGVTRLAVPLHLSSQITHRDRPHSPKLSTLPHSSHASSMTACNVLGPCKGTLHPTVLGAATLLSQGTSTSLLPLPEKRLLTGDHHHDLGEASVGSWGKGRRIEQLSREQPVAFPFLPSTAYHNSIPGKDHFGSPAPPWVAERCSRVLQLGHNG